MKLAPVPVCSDAVALVVLVGVVGGEVVEIWVEVVSGIGSRLGIGSQSNEVIVPILAATATRQTCVRFVAQAHPSHPVL